MNYTKNIFALILIALYLFLPAQNFARIAAVDADDTGTQIAGSMPVKAPCNECPGSSGQGADCCDTSSCNCSIQAPLVQHTWFTYTPVEVVLPNPEPYWSLPQVYFPIFVPPQIFS